MLVNREYWQFSKRRKSVGAGLTFVIKNWVQSETPKFVLAGSFLALGFVYRPNKSVKVTRPLP
ncbi:protein of unknown function [Methylotuvimicrobium alcaliphilum 20Z]|uniref:Uncharacterized protein n=1 Tax=Methylotuvimicrobium alcaliphilum (strain DSM 19304 / NCIMB 14124 / VKM B-2133 / 20Z) TaxID=1091494 RepID=G4T0H1_META2|nr:protein of unknown function [Methylotuvimicrobium alcaliphilum 20Z]